MRQILRMIMAITNPMGGNWVENKPWFEECLEFIDDVKQELMQQFCLSLLGK